MSFDPTLLSRGAYSPPSVPKIDPPEGRISPGAAQSTQLFSSALSSALEVQAQANHAQAAAAVNAAQAAAGADQRARAGLGLNREAPASVVTGPGDEILRGLQSLRGAFDREIRSFSISSAASGTSEGLYQAQVAAANFSIFMDVASKLAGKGDQAFNSLLKGQ